jgi:hypothetical protein
MLGTKIVPNKGSQFLNLHVGEYKIEHNQKIKNVFQNKKQKKQKRKDGKSLVDERHQYMR